MKLGGNGDMVNMSNNFSELPNPKGLGRTAASVMMEGKCFEPKIGVLVTEER